MRTITGEESEDGHVDSVPTRVDADEPTTQAESPGSAPRRPQWLVPVAVGAVMALLVAVLTLGVMIRNRDRALTASRKSDNAARVQLLATRVRVQLLQGDVSRLSSEIVSLRRTGDRLVRQLEARTGERNSVARRLRDTLARVAGIQGQNQVFSTALGAEAMRLTTTKECLLGVRRALDQAAVADFEGTVASLRAVDTQCTATFARSRQSIGFPAYDGDFPDPSLVLYRGQYYGYATNGRVGTVQLVTGRSLGSLDVVGNALPRPASWADRGRTWAPAVWHRGHRWIMYYTARIAGTATQCVSRAVALSPAGPFLDDSAQPIVCQADLGGSIDPSPYVDAAGTPWLLWKSEGPPNQAPTRIWTQQLTAGGTAVVPGTIAELLAPGQPWEAGVIEGPSMVRHGSDYLLFYSANIWSTPNYAIGYAVCRTPIGPCTRPESGAVFRASPPKYGAGGQEFFTGSDGSLMMAYHAWIDGEIGYPNPRRLFIARVDFLDGHPSITPQDLE